MAQLLRLTFKPWRQFRAVKDDAAIRAWMMDVAQASHRAFREGSEASRGGRVYRKRGGRIHRASAPGAWPAKDTGGMLGSIRTQVSATQVVIGTNKFYSRFLRHGTRKMRRRKMSDDALKAGIAKARGRMRVFARFRHV